MIQIDKQNLGIYELWRLYHKGNGDKISYRNKLVEHYNYLIKPIAKKIKGKLPTHIELDDLIQEGVFGLMDAVESFDENLDIKFETHAYSRIRGSILDSLRNNDELPIHARLRKNNLEKATSLLESEFGRKPARSKLINELSKEKYRDRVKLKRKSKIELIIDTENLKNTWQFLLLENKEDSIKNIRYPKSPNPFIKGQKIDTKNLLTKGLTKTERLIINLHYYEEKTMKQIGEIRGLGESGVSQMHSNMISWIMNGFPEKRRASIKQALYDCLV